MNEKWTELLRTHDPAANQSLTSVDRARILQKVQMHRPRWRPAAAAFAMLVIIVVVAAALVRPRDAHPIPQRVSTVRQVQYDTPGGTRILWTLDPDFHM